MLRDLYHRLVPPAIRFPIGRFRRTVLDRILRLRDGQSPSPPGKLLMRVQSTPWIMEYYEVGERCADTVRRILTEHGIGDDQPGKMLDFGCGLGRTLRHFGDTPWQLHGCDIDSEMVGWCRQELDSWLGGVDWRVNGEEPPLPWADGTFDGLWAISVFTHFPTHLQEPWAAELARILRPGGIALVTTMGPWVFDPLPPADEASAAIEGFWFVRAGVDFNDSAAIHTEDGLRHFFEPHFEWLGWTRGGLDGFQDLAVLRKP